MSAWIPAITGIVAGFLFSTTRFPVGLLLFFAFAQVAGRPILEALFYSFALQAAFHVFLFIFGIKKIKEAPFDLSLLLLTALPMLAGAAASVFVDLAIIEKLCAALFLILPLLLYLRWEAQKESRHLYPLAVAGFSLLSGLTSSGFHILFDAPFKEEFKPKPWDNIIFFIACGLSAPLIYLLSTSKPVLEWKTPLIMLAALLLGEELGQFLQKEEKKNATLYWIAGVIAIAVGFILSL